MDTALETSAPLVFAAGNLIHPAETADVAAWNGRHAARQIAATLAAPRAGRAVEQRAAGQSAALAGGSAVVAGAPAAAGRIPVSVAPPLTWISPGAVRPPVLPPGGRFLLRCDSFRPAGRIEVWQGPAAGPDPLWAPGPRPLGPPAGGLGRPARRGIGPGPGPAHLIQAAMPSAPLG